LSLFSPRKHRAGKGVYMYSLLASALQRRKWSNSRPGVFTPPPPPPNSACLNVLERTKYILPAGIFYFVFSCTLYSLRY
jgi:hypothetical protein